MFEVGRTYQTIEGRNIVIVDEQRRHKGYEAVCGSDGKWRYDRPGDCGRVTGSSMDVPSKDNLVPPKS